MEQKIFSKLNLYDQIGYFLVGAIALILIILNGIYFYNFAVPEFTLDTLLIWFIFAYFLGHVIQAIANLINEMPLLSVLVKENKKEFTDREREILEQAKIFFRLKKQDENKIWNFCYIFAIAKDISGHVQTFNANYSLYRGWLIAFLLQSVFLVYQLILQFNLKVLFLLIIGSFLTFIFYKRSKRFWDYTRNKVLETFVVVRTLDL